MSAGTKIFWCIIIPVICIIAGAAVGTKYPRIGEAVFGTKRPPAADTAAVRVDSLKREEAALTEKRRALGLELDSLVNQLTLAKQPKEIEDITNRMKLLESAKRGIEKMLSRPLLQTTVRHPLVRMDSLDEPIKVTALGWLPDAKKESSGGGWLRKSADWLKKNEPDWGSYNEDVLVVVDYSIDANFGVDLDEIKLSDIAGNLVVSGVRSKFVETPRYTKSAMVRELRRRIYDKKGALSNITVRRDSDAAAMARNRAEQYEDEFQQRLRDGTEFPFIDAAVVKLAQVFIKATLAPLYKDVLFEDGDIPGALPILEYLKKEIADNNDRKDKLLEDNKRRRDADAEGVGSGVGSADNQEASGNNGDGDLEETGDFGMEIKSGDGGVGRKGVAGIGYGSGYGSGFGGGGGGVDDLLGGLMGAGGGGLELKKKGELPTSSPDFLKGGALTGGRSKGSITRKITTYTDTLRNAYNERLREKPGLAGKVTVKFAIDEFGKVIFAQLVETTVDDAMFETTVVSLVKKIDFGTIDKPGDVTEITHSFVFPMDTERKKRFLWW